VDRDVVIRRASLEDLDTLVAFALREAREAEGADKDVQAVRRGVAAGLSEPPLARYWVAEAGNDGIVGSISVVTEWSNFHGGFYWWVQSLFVVPGRRGGGVAGALLDHVLQEARGASAVDLRLYVHTANERALRAYRRCGFEAAPYAIMRKPL